MKPFYYTSVHLTGHKVHFSISCEWLLSSRTSSIDVDVRVTITVAKKGLHELGFLVMDISSKEGWHP